MSDGASVAAIAERVRVAFSAADLESLADLLDPDVTWGAPGDDAPACRNRRQVLQWYRNGRAQGRRATMLDVTAHGDKVLVSMTVSGGTARDEAVERWQVLTITAGRITDIRGYDDRDAAWAAVGRQGDT